VSGAQTKVPIILTPHFDLVVPVIEGGNLKVGLRSLYRYGN